MKIWKLSPSAKCAGVTTKEAEVIDYFDGSPMKSWWKPIELSLYKKGKFSDNCDFMNGIPVFSEAVVKCISPHLANDVEFLPAKNRSHQLFLLNVGIIEEVFDQQKSLFERSVSGAIARFSQIYFDPAKLRFEPSIFKALKRNIADVYVNESFIRLIEESRFKGFEFHEVWDSGVTKEIVHGKQLKYESLLREIDNYKGTTYSWVDAVMLVHRGKTLRSGEWKIQEDEKGNLDILLLQDDCSYRRLHSPFIPPGMLYARWHETDKTMFE